MERIGVRELRQHASRWLDKVEGGQAIEITNRGRVVAHLVPPPREEDDWLDRMRRTGGVTTATGDLIDVQPRPAPPGRPSIIEALDESRADRL
jgi:prevent-host-death family protein